MFAGRLQPREAPLRTQLAKLESTGALARWLPIEHCSSGACDPGENLRVQINALGFPMHFRALSIDAMFNTIHGLRPFRIAHYQPGSLSPASKPFSFNVASASLAGFRVEHALANSAAVEVAGSALLGQTSRSAQHRRLHAGGSVAERAMDISAVPTDAAFAPAGEDAAFACCGSAASAIRRMSEWSVASALSEALAQHDRGFRLRSEVEADLPFLTELYAEVRHDELARLDWPVRAKRDFLDAQCRLQRDHYAQHYVGADLLIVERGERAVGRVYVHASAKEIRLMDIAVLRTEQGQGFATTIVRALQHLASRRGRQIMLTLHVEPANPAQRLYERLGFRLIEQRGVYDFLGWKAGMGNRE